jgi:hypothetical protein
LLFEDDKGEDYDQGTLEGGFPEPLEEVSDREVLDGLHGVIETWVF